jgi:hypothetical protein
MSACGAAEETESKVTEPFEGLSCLADFIRRVSGGSLMINRRVHRYTWQGRPKNPVLWITKQNKRKFEFQALRDGKLGRMFCHR